MKIWKNEKMTMVTGDAKEISRLYRNLEKGKIFSPSFAIPQNSIWKRDMVCYSPITMSLEK